ncbi:hypothetical protein PCE1_002094 [Barthelona sp. PCE]
MHSSYQNDANQQPYTKQHINSISERQMIESSCFPLKTQLMLSNGLALFLLLLYFLVDGNFYILTSYCWPITPILFIYCEVIARIKAQSPSTLHPSIPWHFWNIFALNISFIYLNYFAAPTYPWSAWIVGPTLGGFLAHWIALKSVDKKCSKTKIAFNVNFVIYASISSAMWFTDPECEWCLHAILPYGSVILSLWFCSWNGNVCRKLFNFHLGFYIGIITYLAYVDYLDNEISWLVYPALSWGFALFVQYSTSKHCFLNEKAIIMDEPIIVGGVTYNETRPPIIPIVSHPPMRPTPIVTNTGYVSAPVYYPQMNQPTL